MIYGVKVNWASTKKMRYVLSGERDNDVEYTQIGAIKFCILETLWKCFALTKT